MELAFGGAGLLHRVVDPTSDIGQILIFCFCGDKQYALLLYLLALPLVTFAVAPRMFPPIEISERSTWARARGRLLAVVGAAFSFGTITEVIAQQLPS